MKTALRLSTSALCLLGVLAGCANDQLTDSIRATRDSTEYESTHAPKAEAIVRVARATAAKGNWPMAVTLYRRAYSLHADNFEAAHGLAQALYRLGAHDQAKEGFFSSLSYSCRCSCIL